jgi:hypothetical protein
MPRRGPQYVDSYGAEEVQALMTENERQMGDEDGQRLESLAEEREERSQASAAENSRLFTASGPPAPTTASQARGLPGLMDQHPDGPQREERDSSATAFPGEGTSSRPFTATDAAELNAVTNTNKVFDRWLRNVMSTQSIRHLECPARLTLDNGLRTAPRLLEINWRIAVAHGDMIKEKPIPLERMTQHSFYDDTPYRHL